jgi:signal transduction histidine kinase
MMPELDGFALLAAIRGDERWRDLPVVLLSARAGEESRVEGLAAGADDYVVKPFSSRELVARVETQLLRSEVRRLEREDRARLAAILEQAPAGIAILRGPDLVFEVANAAYRALVSGRPLVGRPLQEALPELAVEGGEVIRLLQRVRRTATPYQGHALRVTLADAQGRPEDRWFDFVYQPMLDAAGAVDGIAVVAFDVTELARTQQAAEAASRAKDEFLAMLGHELRNPLAPIMTALQLMRLRGDGAAERERTIIERQVRHLMRLVDDLMDVSRVTRGKVELRREHVEIGEVVARAIETASPLLEQLRHQLRVDVPAAGLHVDGDVTRLAQVVSNLLTNAAKYTPAGGVVEVVGRAEGGDVVLSVRDTGVGIEADLLPRVFDLFAQGPQTAERSRGGLGIGLALVKSLTAMHGGAVEAHSEGADRGSTFTIRLPHVEASARPPSPVARPAAGVRGGGRRVLVVDDNVDAAETLEACLAAWGFSVAVAHDSPTALRTATELEPEVAILDIGLPGMDGYELARRLADVRPGVRMLALTGYGQESDARRARAAGFEAHLVKPVDLDALRRLLDRRDAGAASS